MKIKISPSKPSVGDVVTVNGNGFSAPSVIEVPDENGELKKTILNAFLRVTVTYLNRSESFKTLVGWDGHPEYEAGEISFTFRAEQSGPVDLIIWDWEMRKELRSLSFEVSE